MTMVAHRDGRTVTGQLQRPKAMGFDVSSLDAPRRRNEIQRHTQRLGYHYVYTVRPPEGHTDPIGYAITIAAGIHAAAIIVYDLEAVGHNPARICERFALETICPGETSSRDVPPLIDPAAHGLPETDLSPSVAHRIFRLHIECRAVACPRKAAAIRYLVNTRRLQLAATTPRRRAEARGIAWEPTADDPPGMSDETRSMLEVLDELIGTMRSAAHR
ncbi:hypothetical protein [Nocardia blacklockiae]|uniref:hypothetical protein n=1 Tax=Nocardia blacklockiae TaxID=480036 RepID=UPI0018935E1D|nr:hypothetical protein [Nocardia blacklockiae]MBF6176024.1 hypothetical protein [Nocardia blacklockiae]